MAETIFVKPWPGLILDGIPPNGAAIPRALAEEWIGNHLVVRVRPVTPEPAPVRQPTKPAANARKRRRTR